VNALSMMEYGHKTVLDSLKDLPMDHWNTPGACGTWSVKDIIAHLASYEHMFEDAIGAVVDQTRKTPMLEAMFAQGDSFNDLQVEPYHSQSAEAVLAAYHQAFENTMATARKLPPEMWEKDGLIPWYGDYTLSELMVYTIYGHKREHSAQIGVFHDTVKAL
jgi:uncharacterized protein (TIGR03083 family)